VVNRLFNSLKLRYKLLLSFSVILLLFIFTATVVFQANHKTRILSNKVENDVYPLLQQVNKVSADFRYIGELYSSAIMFKNKSKIDKVHKITPELHKRLSFINNSPAMTKTASKEIVDLFDSYLLLADRSAKAMVAGMDFMAVAPDLGRLSEITGKLKKSLATLQIQLRKDLKKDLRIIDQLASRTTVLVIAVTSLVVLLALGLSFFVTGNITKPIFSLVRAMGRVEKGDLETKLTIPGKDEIAALGKHFNYMITGLKDREFIRDTFKRYVAHSIVDEVLENPEKLKLGGEVRMMTVIFADLAGFTSISERMNPSELVSFLNEYFEEMVGIILDHKGTFDKFEGDLVMAFWGAPLPQQDHAVNACYASLAMQARLSELQVDWAARELPQLNTRIGMNSGDMLVGNLGSKSIMSYTVMGDAVNLASRLEASGKNYGVYNVISDLTYNLAREYVEVRELDDVRVKGKEQPTKIYELIAKKGELSANQKEMITKFSDGRRFYRSHKWDEAIASFEQCTSILSDDPPSQVYINRCQYFKENPPAENWDGIHTFTEK